MRKRWEYRVMSAAVVVGLLDATQRVKSTGDGYVSDDADSTLLNSLLSRGFRWVRTENEMAVFERSVQRSVQR